MNQTPEHIDADLAKRFGADALNLVRAMRQGADTLADAATQALLAQRELADAMQQAVQNGLETVPNLPAPVQALLRDAETWPDWVEPERLQRGVEAYLGVGALWLSISLGPGSLAHTYSSPSIARQLITTGNLEARAMRRLQETANWQYNTLRPGGLLRGAPGYVHTLQVRLLHARVRANLLSRGRGEVPIKALQGATTYQRNLSSADSAQDFPVAEPMRS